MPTVLPPTQTGRSLRREGPWQPRAALSLQERPCPAQHCTPSAQDGRLSAAASPSPPSEHPTSRQQQFSAPLAGSRPTRDHSSGPTAGPR
eukprot:2850029-Prymnesium_polylepis.1